MIHNKEHASSVVSNPLPKAKAGWDCLITQQTSFDFPSSVLHSVFLTQVYLNRGFIEQSHG